MNRMETIQVIFATSEWLTAEQVNALQAAPPANKLYPASDWKRRGLVFSVNHGGTEYFARYQLDALHQPLPIIREILTAFGAVEDGWDLAAWFHFPSGWLVERDERGAVNVAPKDALDRVVAVVEAAAKRLTSYAA